MDIGKYLERIDYHADTYVSREVLFALQKHHLLNVPFENLDIHYGRKITLDLETIFDKIVLRNRGGFCYELNGLFYFLLKSMGFQVRMISARGYDGTSNFGKEYDHLALIVNVDGEEYLVDVGFGKFSLEPLEIIIDEQLNDQFGSFMFSNYDKSYLIISHLREDESIPQYIFQLREREFSDFAEMCHFHQTSADSYFTRNKMISIARENGRVTLTDKFLKISQDGNETLVEFDQIEFDYYLQKNFGVVI